MKNEGKRSRGEGDGEWEEGDKDCVYRIAQKVVRMFAQKHLSTNGQFPLHRSGVPETLQNTTPVCQLPPESVVSRRQ